MNMHLNDGKLRIYGWKMMMRRLIITVSVILFAGGQAYAASPSTAKYPSAASVQLRAKQVCKLIGWTTHGEPVACLRRDTRGNEWWDVNCSPAEGHRTRGIQLQIDKNSGLTKSGWNYFNAKEARQAKGTSYSKSKLDAIAAKYLRSAGINMDGVVLEQLRYTPSGKMGKCVHQTVWHRDAKEYRFQADACLNSHNGELISFHTSTAAPFFRMGEVGGAESKAWSDAVARARRICKLIGWSPKGEPKRVALYEKWSPEVWPVMFFPNATDDHADISVILDKRTGAVKSLSNQIKLAEMQYQHGAPCADSKLNSAAEKYIKLIGIKLDEVVRDNRGSALNNSGKASDPCYVWWHRQYKGYRFYSDSVCIRLNPRDASLIEFDQSIDSPLPSTLDVRINKSDAERRAIKQASNRSGSVSVIGSDLQIFTEVQHSKDYVTSKPIRSSLAWVVRMKGSHSPTIVVCVDAGDGRILNVMSSKF